MKKLVKYFEFFLIGLATVILASCDLSLSPPKASTVQIAIKAPLINEFSAPSSRAILGFTGQTLTITITAQDMNPIVQDLPLDPKTNLYSGSFSLPKRVPITFTVEAKDVTGKVYVSAKQTKVITKNNETLSITLAPVLTGNETSITSFDGYNLASTEGEVTTALFKPVIATGRKEIYSYTATNLSFVVSDKNGKVINKNNTWTMKPNEEVIILYTAIGKDPSLEVTSLNQSGDVRALYYVSNSVVPSNTGLTQESPISLNEALAITNALNLTGNEYVEIQLIEDITGSFSKLDVHNNVVITSVPAPVVAPAPVAYSISFTNDCETLFNVSQNLGGPVTLTLKNITIGNAQSSTPEASKGLIAVNNATLVLGESCILQNNTALDNTFGNAGAVVLGDNAALYMEGGSINSCQGKYAGAIYVGDGAQVYIKNDCFGKDTLANSATEIDGKNNIYIASYSLDDLFLWEDTQTYKNFNSYTALKENSTNSAMLGIDNDETAMNYLFAGKGIAANPYKISSTEDIRAMSVSVPSTILAKEFKQTDNIEASNFSQFQGIPEFSGTYDGDGYAITKLSIEPSGEKDNGFFRFLKGAIVKNLYLDAEIEPYQLEIDGIYTFGLLAGYAQNSTITNCGTTGSLTVNPASEPESGKSLTVGGLVGYSLKNTIEQCFSAAHLNANYPVYMGGLVGCLNGGSITNAYAAPTNQATLSSDSYIGALVGYLYTLSNKPTITNTYATLFPDVTGNNANVGFIGGSNDENYSLDNSYQLFEKVEEVSGIWVEEIVEDDFTKQSSYVLFDFEDIWTIDEGTSYPYFQSQNQKQTPDFFKPAPTP